MTLQLRTPWRKTLRIEPAPELTLIPDADWNDERMLDEVYGLTVAFPYSGAAHYSPRQTLTGVIIDVKTSRRGERSLLVKSAALNVAKWVALNDCQFVPETAAAHSAEAEYAAL